MENPIAFPNTELNAYGKFYDHHKGMTLRDYFAAKAMQGLVTDPNLGTSGNYEETISEISYRLADAMLKQREL